MFGPWKQPLSSSSSRGGSTCSSGPLSCSFCQKTLPDHMADLLRSRPRSHHLFCSYECGLELGMRAGSSSIIRRQLFALVSSIPHVTPKAPQPPVPTGLVCVALQEHGVCQKCGLDAHGLFNQAKSLTPPERVQVRPHSRWWVVVTLSLPSC